MPNGYTLPPKLGLVMNHLKALRTIDEYMSANVGLQKDINEFFNHITKELNRTVLKPAGWQAFHRQQGLLYSFPADGKWQVVRGDQIGIIIYPAAPVGDDYDTDPSVGLYAPDKWKLLKHFSMQLKAPEGFDHIKDHEGEDYAEDGPLFKYIRYGECVDPDGQFNKTTFMKGFHDATATLVGMAGTIDGIVDRLQKRS